MKRYNLEIAGPSTDNEERSVNWITWSELLGLLRSLEDGDDATIHTVESDV